ncbi:Protein tyrosine kinase [Carpediemonas membranifera]|uniref:Protein tyrosine kinase n=1 Tax=Carpediemonas membranifera TaxID=201153 RepID=A0A8J6E4S3_9EUKA|nr:Protein tyrosine kinase [Carpediemonas membranifera]|eukprot:KAG9397301.1 Protein tyrosine kinase [Carpediemonas membranifera]
MLAHLAGILTAASSSSSSSNIIVVAILLACVSGLLLLQILLLIIAALLMLSLCVVIVIAIASYIVYRLTSKVRRPTEDDPLLPPNPAKTPLTIFEERGQAKAFPRNGWVATMDGPKLRPLPFEDSAVYHGKVYTVRRPARVWCNLMETPEHAQNAERAYMATRAQHDANIIGICRVYGVLRTQGRQLIFKEKPTRTLEHAIQNKGMKISWNTRLAWAQDVATTLAQAHAQHLPHGNICGKTVLQFGDHAKVDDFGLTVVPGATNLYEFDVDQYGRLFWCLMHRRTPPDSTGEWLASPPKCPVALHTAVMACVSQNKPDFAGVCKILGCAPLRSAPVTVQTTHRPTNPYAAAQGKTPVGTVQAGGEVSGSIWSGLYQ